MKRTWTIFTLFFAGLIAFTNLQANSVPTCTPTPELVSMQLQKLTETEAQILQKAAPLVGLSYQELVMLYEDGNATIEDLGNNQYRVTAYSNSGNPVIAILENSL